MKTVYDKLAEEAARLGCAEFLSELEKSKALFGNEFLGDNDWHYYDDEREYTLEKILGLGAIDAAKDFLKKTDLFKLKDVFGIYYCSEIDFEKLNCSDILKFYLNKVDAGEREECANIYDGSALLSIAVMRGDADVAELLLEDGANPNCIVPEDDDLYERDFPKEPILWYALRNGNRKIIESLLKHGADAKGFSFENNRYYERKLKREDFLLLRDILTGMGKTSDDYRIRAVGEILNEMWNKENFWV